MLLGGAAAVTSRIGLADRRPGGIRSAADRHRHAGATMNMAYGPRFVLGLGRRHRMLYAGHGFPDGGEVNYTLIVDYATIVRRLWQGETIDYDGPAGTYENLRMDDIPDTPPQIWFVHLGGPKASKVAANLVLERIDIIPT